MLLWLRSSVKVKVKYQCHIFHKMAIKGALVFTNTAYFGKSYITDRRKFDLLYLFSGGAAEKAGVQVDDRIIKVKFFPYLSINMSMAVFKENV